MPIADFAVYNKILDQAQTEHYALPAINVTSLSTANAAMRGFAEARSDGMIQVSTGGGAFASGVGDMALGAISLAEHMHRVAEQYKVYFILHTDHCTKENLPKFVQPLITESKKRRQQGLTTLFNSHMFDGSDLNLAENMQIAQGLLAELKALDMLLEVETGVVGGEEDGLDRTGVTQEKLYTSPEDMLYVYEQLNPIGGRYLFAAAFGNVHGVYKPGNVKLKPTILELGQQALQQKYANQRFDLVFHGGSGSALKDIRETLNYGVVKMNVDTDTQYAYTQGVVDHLFKNYSGALRIDGEMGDKKVYDPRVYQKKGQQSMAERVKQACADLRSAGRTLHS